MNIVGHSNITINFPSYNLPSRIFGWVKDVNGNPVAKRVLLFNNVTGSFLSSTISRASDGYWCIVGIRSTLLEGKICEVAIDDTKTYDSVVRDHKSLVV